MQYLILSLGILTTLSIESHYILVSQILKDWMMLSGLLVCAISCYWSQSSNTDLGEVIWTTGWNATTLHLLANQNLHIF